MQTKRNILTAMLALGFLASMGAMPTATALPGDGCKTFLANEALAPVPGAPLVIKGALSVASEQQAFLVALPVAASVTGWTVTYTKETAVGPDAVSVDDSLFASQTYVVEGVLPDCNPNPNGNSITATGIYVVRVSAFDAFDSAMEAALPYTISIEAVM